jgi:hypothetical protein
MITPLKLCMVVTNIKTFAMGVYSIFSGLGRDWTLAVLAAYRQAGQGKSLSKLSISVSKSAHVGCQ